MFKISKSDYLDGLRCEKLLWLKINAREDVPPPSASAQARMNEGSEVGRLAHKLYPDGRKVVESGWGEAKQRTLSLLVDRKPVFEAAFGTGRAATRVDVLVPALDGEWDVVEVKSSTEVKKEHKADVAFQANCLSSSGVKVRRFFVMHVNKHYRRHGLIDCSQFFRLEDVSNDVVSLASEVSGRLDDFSRIVESKDTPAVPIGTYCKGRDECPMKPSCWGHLPKGNVTNLYRAGRKAFEFLPRWPQIVDVPPDLLTEAQLVQQSALTTNKPQLNKQAVKGWLSELQYPLHFLDFETIAPAIPQFDGSRPYQHIPFQFSLLVVDDLDSPTKRFDFLEDSNHDPRPALVDALKCVQPTGSILAYHMSFEASRLQELAEDYPNEAHLLGIKERLVDMADPFKDFLAYHPKQEGRWSIKKVLPAWTSESYDGLSVASGLDASMEYLRMTREDVTADVRDRIRNSLIEYCHQDTVGMLLLFRRLGSLADLG